MVLWPLYILLLMQPLFITNFFLRNRFYFHDRFNRLHSLRSYTIQPPGNCFNWNGVTVTLLWLLTSVIIFSVGVYRKSVPLRLTAILLIGITLLKLVVLDSMSFSPVQKIIAYLVLGVLLLVVSFFYQKFRKQLFRE